MANRLSRRGRQTLLVLHYVSSVGWLGAHEMAHIFDLTMLTVLSLGSATTGILLAVRGKWGLLGYWWVVVKLIVTVALIVGIPAFVGDRIRAAVAATASGPRGPGCPAVRDELLISSVVIVTTLILVTAVSVVKPWGRTPLGERRVRVPRERCGKPVKSIAVGRNRNGPPLGDNQYP